MHRLIFLLLPLICACHDQAQNPDLWTVQEIHQQVGLVDGHQRACSECHQGIGFKGLAPNCESCHLALYSETTNPNHSSAGYPILCVECHVSLALRRTCGHSASLGFKPELGASCASTWTRDHYEHAFWKE